MTKRTLINARKLLYLSLRIVKNFKLIFRNTSACDVLDLKRVLRSVTLLTTTQTINKIWHARPKLQRTKRQLGGRGGRTRGKNKLHHFWYKRHTSLVARRQNKTQFGYVISWLMRRKTLPRHIMLVVLVNGMLFHILSSLKCRTFLVTFPWFNECILKHSLIDLSLQVSLTQLPSGPVFFKEILSSTLRQATIVFILTILINTRILYKKKLLFRSHLISKAPLVVCFCRYCQDSLCRSM